VFAPICGSPTAMKLKEVGSFGLEGEKIAPSRARARGIPDTILIAGIVLKPGYRYLVLIPSGRGGNAGSGIVGFN